MNLEIPREQQSVDGSTIEDLKSRRKALEDKIILAEQQKEKDIQKKLEKREVAIAEDARITSLLDEAVQILEYYEKQENAGLLKDEKDVIELGNIKKTVDSLEKQKEALSNIYDGIMNDQELYNRVLDSAGKENKEIDDKRIFTERSELLKKRIEEAELKMKESVKIFCQKIIQAEEEKALFDSEYKNKWSNINIVHSKILKIWGNFSRNTHINHDLPKSYDEFIKFVKNYKKNLSILKIKERSSVGNILKQKDEFLDYYKLIAEGDDLNKKRKEIYDYLELKEDYTNIMNQAWEEENKILEDFPEKGNGSNDIPMKCYNEIYRYLREIVGLGNQELNDEKKPHGDLMEENERHNQILKNIQKSNPYIHFQNPKNK